MIRNGRRNFINKTALAAAGILAAKTLAGNQSVSAPHDPAHDFVDYQFSTDEEVVKRAKEEIKSIRMSDVEILLIDRSGKPLKNIPVDIVQTSHSFLFGDCNPEMDKLFRKWKGDSEKLTVYRRLFADVLNTVNATCYWTERPRNNMAKTEEFQGEPYYDGFAESVNWANSNGLTAKGHPLFWPVEKAIPDWLKKYPYETQMKFLEVRLRSLVGRFKGKVKVWDAVNEMLWEPALKNLPLRQWPYLETIDNIVEYVAFVLRISREEDPDAIYLLNDYGLELPWKTPLQSKEGIVVTPQLQRKRVLELVEQLKKTGDQPNAIGLQCHDGWMQPKEQMAFYNEMSKAGLPIHITEFWAHTDHLQKSGLKLKAADGDFTTENFQNNSTTKYSAMEIDNLQADYVENYLTCAFSHPAIDAFIFWGFMSMAVDWKENDSPSYELKPVYQRVKKLIKEDWTTHISSVTNSDGVIKFRGFHGGYSVRYPLSDAGPKNAGVSFDVGRFSDNKLTLKTIL